MKSLICGDDINCLYEQICQQIEKQGIFDQTELLFRKLFAKQQISAVMIIDVVALVSILSSLLVFLTTLFNPKLNAHPYKLITVITLVDASYVMIFVFYGHMCEWKLPEIFTYTTVFPYFYLYGYQLTPQERDEWDFYSLSMLETFGRYLFTGFILLSLLLNTFLCLDLYLTVKNPFAKSSGRSVSCGSISVIIFIGLIAALLLNFLPYLGYDEVQMIFIGFVIFSTIAMYTIVSTTRRLIKPGFSKEVRRTVLLRQIRYILTIFIVFTFFFVTKSL